MSNSGNPSMQNSVQTEINELYQVLAHPLQETASQQGMQIKVTAHYVDFIRQNNIIRLAVKHFVYAHDIIKAFDYYFSAVEPENFHGFRLVDYSLPKYHEVPGYMFGPVYFPSLSEPMVTTVQYLDFANLKPGSNVLDLGAYSGLTSIMFKERVGRLGKVVAVDADEQNIGAIEKNFKMYKQHTGNDIDLLYAAVWSHCNGLSFSSEGNMGSSASEIVGNNRGNNLLVKSLTLDKIVDIAKLDHLDFIKCDVEGAEAVIFEQADFLIDRKPRIIIEPHFVGGVETTEKCIRDLAKYGYQCKRLHQTGVDVPLLECHPPL